MSDVEPEVTPAAEEPTPEQEPENPEDAPEAEPENDAEKYRKIAEDQRKRAEKAEAENKKLKARQESPAPASEHDLSPEAQKRLDRIELNSLGIKDREEQDFVLGAAKRMGVEPSEAASDEVVTAKLEKMRETRKTREATPPPSRGGQATTNVTRLAEKALSTGELPTDPALRAKVREEMKRLTRK